MVLGEAPILEEEVLVVSKPLKEEEGVQEDQAVLVVQVVLVEAVKIVEAVQVDAWVLEEVLEDLSSPVDQLALANLLRNCYM